MVDCPSCHAPNPTDARFCNRCGTALASVAQPTAASAVAGERRVVTVLFCDVAGSTALAHELDPEVWSEIMAGVFRRFTEPIRRYGGTVARLMGDAVLAFFGAPEAHEDDPRRAVLAGLAILEGIEGYRAELHRRHGLDLRVRVGINTGLAVVGEVGTDAKMEYSAMGDAVNLAARMEQTAEPGTVRIAEDTYRRVAPLFDVEPLGPVVVKGRPEPVPAYRVLRVRARPGAERGIEGLEAPLVGRDREIALLRGALEELRGGRGQIVALMGEAGLGKSRLLQELRSGHERAGAPAMDAASTAAATSIAWHEGRSYSYQTATPYAPIADLLRSMFELHAPSDVAPFERVRRAVAKVAPDRAPHDAPILAWVTGLEGPEIGAEMRFLEPDEIRHRVFQAVQTFVEATAQRTPTVVVQEDLHWADRLSIELLESLLPIADRAMLMILAAFRPQRSEPAWRFHEVAQREFGHRYLPVTLVPLDDAASRELVAHLLHVEDLPEGVRAKILAKAEGNPFFVEEVVRALLDAGLIQRRDGRWLATAEIHSIRVPDTLAGLLTARLDRLDLGAKRVLQTASVIGREFALAALEEVHEQPAKVPEELSTLERRELIRLRARFPDTSYQFKHVLIQETTYGSLLLRRRRDLHRRVAECLERLAPHRVEDVARHWLAADQAERALPWIAEAGARALAMYALNDARRWLEQATDLLGDATDPGLARKVHEGLGKTRELSGDAEGALRAYDAMRELATAAGDLPMRVSALNKRAYVVLFHFGRMDEAFELLDEAERLARERGPLPESIETSMIRCGACAFAGKFGEALDTLGDSVEVAAELGMDGARAQATAHLASTLVFKVEFDAAERRVAESLELSERVGDLYHLVDIQGFAVPHLRLVRGDLPGAIAAAEEGRDGARRIGVAFLEAQALLVHARLLHRHGDLGGAMRSFRMGLDAALLSGPRAGFFVPWLITGLWRSALEVGEAAYQAVRRELADALAPLAARGGTTTWADLGEIAVAHGELDEAERWFERALEVPGPAWLLDRPRAWLGTASVALARGRMDTPCLVLARAFVEEHRMRYYLPELLAAEAERAARVEGPEHGAERFAEAAREAERFGFRLVLAQALRGQAAALRELGRAAEAEPLAARAEALRAAAVASALALEPSAAAAQGPGVR